MKKLFSLALIGLCAIANADDRPPGDEVLKLVRDNLPERPLKLTGSLKVKAPNGFTKSNLPVTMELAWGGQPPSAKYVIDSETLEITWVDDAPRYAFSNAKNKPTDDILGSGVTWSDLSFSMLWWPNSKLVGEGRKINRACYIVDVPVPDSEHIVRLWIEKKMGMLLEAQTLDAKENALHRLKIKSIKKMDGMWVGSDLEIKNLNSGAKTDLIVNDLEWTGPAPRAEIPAAFDPAESINRLGIDLYREVANEPGNLFFSPYSISTALALTYGGARGETAEQMNEALHFGGPGVTHPAFSALREKIIGLREKGGIELNVANSLWPDETHSFLPDYLAMTKVFYAAQLEPVDFKNDPESARLRINGWVAEKTADKIKDLLAEGTVNNQTRLVIANAIYFKGDWAEPFKKEATREAPFTLASGERIGVPTMTKTADFKLASAERFQALELPYEGGDLSMLVLLPAESSSLAELEDSLSTDLLAELKFKEREVALQLPKFTFEWKTRLGQTLAKMGMPLAFDPTAADFSGMDGSRELSIGLIVHQAFVEVNEEGTEAAAATAVGMRATSMPPSFRANRPFLFLIRENTTGAILFLGRVMDPTK